MNIFHLYLELHRSYSSHDYLTNNLHSDKIILFTVHTCTLSHIQRVKNSSQSVFLYKVKGCISAIISFEFRRAIVISGCIKIFLA